jgi:hypothetical protein
MRQATPDGEYERVKVQVGVEQLEQEETTANRPEQSFATGERLARPENE